MSSTLAELRPHAHAPEEISPELALVCPDTRRLARELLPDRDPYAFLRGVPRERETASVAPEQARSPALRLVPPVPQAAPRVVLERAQVEPPRALVPPATEPAARPPAPASEPQPRPAETVRIAPRPAPASPVAPSGAAVPEPEPDEQRPSFLAYAARELVLLAIAAATTVVGLAGAMTLVDVFVR